jgi:transcriptional regulator with XRE-family HTH domain
MHLSTNLKILRKKTGLTQDEAAEVIGISRTKLNAYENAHSEPTIDGLISLSQFYKVNIDTLIKTDFNQLSEFQITELQSGNDTFISGSSLRVLATTVNQENNENIELIPIKAKAGYKAGYNDPEFLSQLPTFQLPFLSQNKKYRTFQIDGNSMLPIKDKSYVVGEFLQNWNDIKDGEAYVVLTLEDGIVFKILYNNLKQDKSIVFHSLNPEFQDYKLSVEDIKEVWKFVCFISQQMPDSEHEKKLILEAIINLEEKINLFKNKV